MRPVLITGVLCLSAAGCASASGASASFEAPVRHTYRGTGGLVMNPERGFRGEEGHGCDKVPGVAVLQEYNLSIVQLYCYMPADPTLSNATLTGVETAFRTLRAAGVKALWRFAYDRLSPGENSYTLETVLGHIDQLTPLVQANLDVLYVLQAGFIGSWGEWHGSQHDFDMVERAQLVERELFHLLPADRKIQVRTPVIKLHDVLGHGGASDQMSDRPVEMQFGIADAASAATNVAYARVGFDNDCVLSYSDDGGTWGQGPGRGFFPKLGDVASGSFGTPTFSTAHGLAVDPQYEYARRESPFVPMDGEMDWNTGFNPKTLRADGITAAWRLREMHYSTLSLEHGYLDGLAKGETNETIAVWTRTRLNVNQLKAYFLPCSPAYCSFMAKHTEFEYIRDHLGYRIELEQATFPNQLSQPASLNFTATLVNYGFAAPISPRPVYIVLLRGAEVVWRAQADADVRDWQPHRPGDPTYTPLPHVITASGQVAGLAAGTVSLGIMMPDARSAAVAYSLRLANEDVAWAATDGGGVNVLHDVTLS